MDGVLLFVNGHSHDQVEDALRPYGLKNDCVSDGFRTFFFRRYLEWASEQEPKETLGLEKRLGGSVTAAFVAESRHGMNARFALEALAGVMEKMHRTVLEDHFGGLWDSRQVTAYAAAADHDVFSLAHHTPTGG
jgi:hypothetical protein